ncbi:MAG: hypothetical protein ABI461_11930 [Polyangiaceae bacterium]
MGSTERSARRVHIRLRSAAIAACAVTCVATFSGAAFAIEPEVTSDTTAQFYDVRSPTGENVLARRRLTTTLGVAAYDLLGVDKLPAEDGRLQPELSFRARMRYDADYGANAGEATPSATNAYVPGFSRGPVDLMYGYVEGRRFAKGWLNFKLGRQYVTDSLGWYSFDGGEAKITTPLFFSVEAYGGLEVRGGMPLSSPRFEADGVWRGDRTGFDPSTYPSFQANDIAPAIGVALETAGFTWVHGRLTYRRVYNTGSSNVSQFANGLSAPTLYDGTRISTEKIGYSLEGTLLKYGGVKGGFAWDMYSAKMASIYASLDGYVTDKLTLSLDYDYYAPTYDADSIWNFFLGEPTNDVGARANYALSDSVSLAAGGHGRIFTVQDALLSNTASPNITIANYPGYVPSNGHAFDGGFDVAIRQRIGENQNGVRGTGNFGQDGDRVGGEFFFDRVLYDRYLAGGRMSVFQWNDKLRPDRDAVSFGAVASVGYKLAKRSRVRFDQDMNLNRIVGAGFRSMVWLTVAVAP